MMEMGLLPVVCEVRGWCMQYWYKILMSKVYEGRLSRKVAARAVEWGKGCWIRSILPSVWVNLGGRM